MVETILLQLCAHYLRVGFRTATVDADAATRALRTYLLKREAQEEENAYTEDTGVFESSSSLDGPLEDKLPPPVMPENMELTRSNMLHYLRRNFDLGKQHIADAPINEQDVLEKASAVRCVAFVLKQLNPV